MQLRRDQILDAAKALATERGYAISDEILAKTGSAYFTVSKHIAGEDQGFTVRVSDHKSAGWQVRARYAFVTTHCIRRANRDLARLARRLDRLSNPAAVKS